MNLLFQRFIVVGVPVAPARRRDGVWLHAAVVSADEATYRVGSTRHAGQSGGWFSRRISLSSNACARCKEDLRSFLARLGRSW